MKLYKIPVMWQMYGYMDIEAETLDEARNEAYHFLRTLPEGNYVEDSFEVDEDVVEGMNHTKETETEGNVRKMVESTENDRGYE